MSAIVPEIEKVYKSSIDPIIVPVITKIIEGLNNVSEMATIASGILEVYDLYNSGVKWVFDYFNGVFVKAKWKY